MPLVNQNDLEQIDLGNDEWVKIPKLFSYENMLGMIGDEKKNEAERGKTMLVSSIKEWNLKGEDGDVAELTEANIMKLDIESVNKITSAITEKVVLDKKKLPKSTEQ